MPKTAQPEPDDASLEAAIEGVTDSMLEQAESAPESEPLPSHKDDLVALAIDRGIPSYEAWDMTVPELTARLES